MAGLLTARVLSESFREVTVIERDVLPAEAGQRRGVPQGRHLHALLCRGGQILDDLFPGLTKQVAEAGAPVGDLLGNIRWFLSGHRLAQVDIGDLYRDGSGVKQDYAQAASWYRKAADQGNSDGQFDLAALYEHGQGLTADLTQAIAWYRKAADQGNTGAADAVKRLTGQAVTTKK